MERTINWPDSCIVCAVRQERRKEVMPPGMFGNLKPPAFHLKNPEMQDAYRIFNQNCELVSQLPNILLHHLPDSGYARCQYIFELDCLQ